ncbi:PilZ domain-containing protein [Stakelama marina]|uniref:PilZ domain-containing protein n=1 Tax=Stakelama marina TaxID=2826939 RepID=UPI0024C44381|nr:PilZ domain-containing protein [Stakelama marina]
MKPIQFAAEFEPAEPPARRRSERSCVSFDAKLGRGGLARTLCKVVDLSRHGCRIQTYSPMRENALIWLTLPGIGPRVARVAWAGDFLAGCAFEEPLDPQELDHLLAV